MCNLMTSPWHYLVSFYKLLVGFSVYVLLRTESLT
jgi:hypothetical protein